MAATTLTEVNDQIQKYWSPIFTKQLRESLMLGSLINKEYDGEIKKGGDTVYVSQINAPTGELRTVGTDADQFGTDAMSTTRIAIQADKRAVAAYEFHDLVDLQSQISRDKSEVMDSLVFAMNKQINDYLYGLVAPSAAAPAHDLTGVTDMNSGQVSAIRVLAGQAKWDKSKPWYALLDPSYYGDVLDDTTLASSDFGASDAPVISGEVALKRFGFNILEDNSRAADYGLFFHPDFMHLVMQTGVSTKISDLHSNQKFGFVMSVDVIFGAALGIGGDEKHIRVINV